jgi:hypothetical protein
MAPKFQQQQILEKISTTLVSMDSSLRNVDESLTTITRTLNKHTDVLYRITSSSEPPKSLLDFYREISCHTYSDASAELSPVVFPGGTCRPPLF